MTKKLEQLLRECPDLTTSYEKAARWLSARVVVLSDVEALCWTAYFEGWGDSSKDGARYVGRDDGRWKETWDAILRDIRALAQPEAEGAPHQLSEDEARDWLQDRLDVDFPSKPSSEPAKESGPGACPMCGDSDVRKTQLSYCAECGEQWFNAKTCPGNAYREREREAGFGIEDRGTEVHTKWLNEGNWKRSAPPYWLPLAEPNAEDSCAGGHGPNCEGCEDLVMVEPPEPETAVECPYCETVQVLEDFPEEPGDMCKPCWEEKYTDTPSQPDLLAKTIAEDRGRDCWDRFSEETKTFYRRLAQKYTRLESESQPEGAAHWARFRRGQQDK